MPYSKFETVVIMLKFKRKKNIFDCTKYKELLVSHNPGKPLPGKGFGDPEQAFRLFWPAVLGRTKKCKTHFRAVFFAPKCGILRHTPVIPVYHIIFALILI